LDVTEIKAGPELDKALAEAVGMYFNITKNGCVEALYCEEGSCEIFAVPFHPSQCLEDAIWASRVAGHRSDCSSTDPLDVCAAILELKTPEKPPITFKGVPLIWKEGLGADSNGEYQ
jgi:hypothetical protein